MNRSRNELMALWVKEYSTELYSWARHKTSDKEWAEDLVQETFIAAFQSLEKFEGTSSAKTWLFSILNHKLLDYYRKKYRTRDKIESQKSDLASNQLAHTFFAEDGHWNDNESPINWDRTTTNLMDDEDFNSAFSGCIDKLPLHWNAAVRMKYLEQRNGEEICQELEVSTTNFWQIIHRSKIQLKKCLELNWFNK